MFHLDMLVAPLSRSTEQRFSTWGQNYHGQWEYYTMPRSKAKSTVNSGKSVSHSGDDLQWLNIRLEEEDIAVIVALSQSTDELRDELVALVANGGNFSIKLDVAAQEYSVFVSDSRGDNTGKRYGMSGRAKTPILAICAVLVKLRVWKSSPDRFTKSGESLGIR